MGDSRLTSLEIIFYCIIRYTTWPTLQTCVPILTINYWFTQFEDNSKLQWLFILCHNKNKNNKKEYYMQWTCSVSCNCIWNTHSSCFLKFILQQNISIKLKFGVSFGRQNLIQNHAISKFSWYNNFTLYFHSTLTGRPN